MRKTYKIIIFILNLTCGLIFFSRNASAAMFSNPMSVIEHELSQNNRAGEESFNIERPKISYDPSGLKDPFKAPVIGVKDSEQAAENVQEALPALNVQGVIWGTDTPQAIVNNKVVKTGDSIEGAEIVFIDKSGIRVFFANAEHFISAPAGTGRQEQE